jgi:hypothetical protein
MAEEILITGLVLFMKLLNLVKVVLGLSWERHSSMVVRTAI